MCKQRLLKPFTLGITGSVRVHASDACVSVEHTASWYVLSVNARDNLWSVHIMLESEPNVVCAMTGNKERQNRNELWGLPIFKPNISTTVLNLTIIELTMWVDGWQPTPTTADVTVTKIAGYVRVRIFMNRYFWH